MPYSPTNWVEALTKLGPTNMNHLETGVSDATTTADAAIPKSTVTTAGDTIYATGAAALTRLGVGTAHQALYVNAGATAPTWAASVKSLLTAAGDTVYASGANTLARLPAGSNGQVLTLASGLPSWATTTAATVYAKTTQKDVSSTVAKTDLFFGEITIAANTMSPSGAILIDCGGDYLNNSASSQTIRMELKLGSQVLWDSGLSDNITTSANYHAWNLSAVIQALASTSSQRGSGVFGLGSNNLATTGTGAISSPAIGMTANPFITAATTVAMTSSQTLTFSITHSSSAATVGMRLYYARIVVY